MPKCIHCRHAIFNEYTMDFECWHPKNSDPVIAFTSCRVERGLTGACSPTGYNFSPAPPRVKTETGQPKKRSWWVRLIKDMVANSG